MSLMPEGIRAGMTPQEFSDLIEYLTTLRQPETAVSANRGCRRHSLDRPPVTLRPFFREEPRIPHAFVQKPGIIRFRAGLVRLAARRSERLSGGSP